MRTSLYWEQFAEVVVNQLVRAKPGEPFLIVINTNGDLNLAQACLAAGIRAGADSQLVVKPRLVHGTASKSGPILSDAIRASKVILDLSDELDFDPVTLEARKKGTRVLATNVCGIEEYVIRALLDVDIEAMIRNAELVKKLWDQAKQCRVTSPQGTDLSFNMMSVKAQIGDGALSEDGEIDFCPGAQVTIEHHNTASQETINGRIVVDASDTIQGIVHSPYTFIIEKGVIISIEGGREADVVRDYLKKRNEPKVYSLVHTSIGLNPQARISGNFIEDERVLAALDFGFGRGCPYHEDVMVSTPTIYVDGKEMSGGGELNPEMGFEEV
ncbi:hypothetical protein ES703_114092 [subsurface metagenome]